MASVQEPCNIKIIARRPSGEERQLLSEHVTVLAPAGGAPDGAATSTAKINERHVVPINPNILRNEDIIFVEVTAPAADGIDVSDSIWAIPIVTATGVKHLSQSDFQNPAAADATLVANLPLKIAGYKITEGPVQFGGSHIYLDIQDDTA